MSAIRREASAAKRAAEYVSVGSMMSIKWCGTRARSAALALAVPMSMPR